MAVCLAAGKRQRLPPQDPNYHFYNHRDSALQKGPMLEEAAMALLLLEGADDMKVHYVCPVPSQVSAECMFHM